MTTILDIPGSNPPNPFSGPIQALLNSTNLSLVTTTIDETAAYLITMVTTSSNPTHALWELWDPFFTAVATCSTSHAPHLALLEALRMQPPMQRNNIPAGSDGQRQLNSHTQTEGKLHWPALPRFSAQWRDVHDILEAWRDWDGVRTSGAGEDSTANALSSSGYEYYLRFCVFSAALLKATKGKGEVHPVWVLYACRNVLERGRPQSRQPRAHRMPMEKVWALDVRVAATWMRDGGWELWETDHEELRRHWEATLDDKTELWPREDGLTRTRWGLWRERLRALSTDEVNLDGETRAVVTEAAGVIRGIMEERSI